MFIANERWIVSRSHHIDDPIARLRFLRQQSHQHDHTHVLCRYGRFIAVLLLCFFSVGATRPVESLPDWTVTASRKRDSATPIWIVERTKDHELYSNGLRIDTRYATANHARSYVVYIDGHEQRRATLAGIVYHSTESDVLPFTVNHNDALLRTTAGLIAYVQRRSAYHYLIDRFGQVYRIVRESDAADHAGNAVWAWDGVVCTNLNHAFAGVAFEGRTDEPITPAQIQAGRLLTEALISRNSIGIENCVTHAQVSVNPANMRVGWHTDWARSFPFAELGLPNNYEHVLPSITEFGFTPDASYFDMAGEGLWVGMYRSESLLKRTAADQGYSASEWRRKLNARYAQFSKRG